MVAGPDGALVAAAANDLYVSEDHGEHWSLAKSGMPTVRSMVLM